MKKLIAPFILAVVCFLGGCGTSRLVGIMGIPTRHEKKFPAEYDLKQHKNQRILVLVNQGGWLGADVNLRLHLTEAINKELVKKIRIKPEYLVSYDELSGFRSGRADFSLLSPVQVGQALKADMVLLVVIEDYQLYEMAQSGYLKGFLSTQAGLFETATAAKLWPEPAKGKCVEVGFEVEEHGRDVAISRLANALAYCAVRYFYDCPMDKFKIAEDKSGAGWKDWAE